MRTFTSAPIGAIVPCMNHVHVSVPQMIVTAATVILTATLWRLAAYRLSDRPVGQAMLTIL